MTILITILAIIFLVIVLVQIAKINEITAGLRGEEEDLVRTSHTNARWMLIFGIVFFAAFGWSALYYTNYLLGYGPHQSASAHGGEIDSMFDVTLIFTAIVFVICHIALFWFTYRYRYQTGRKVLFLPHDNRLEVIWTAVPAFVMVILVVKGLVAWNEIMADVKEGEEYIEVEATGWQFAWNLRYPGDDNQLGVKDFRLIKPGTNELGQDWEDPRNHDDFNADELVLPKDKKVRLRITARDVLHNFYLPHFRVKMDAVPGIPTYFVFTPIKTTEEYRQELRKYPEYNLPSDPSDPNSEPLWKTFQYELACAELCGKGHYSMRRIVKIVTEAEYKEWLKKQKSHYLTNIRHTEEDPYKGRPIPAEIKAKATLLEASLKKALDSANTSISDRTITLDNIYFKTGSAELSDESQLALEIILQSFQDFPKLKVEISGHTDNVGDASANLALSLSRAASVKNYLVAKGVAESRIVTSGHGSAKPIDSNDTELGRSRNRRIDFKIISF